MRHMGGAMDYTPGRAAEGLEAIRQRAAHILDTPRGALPQDPEWGIGIADWIGVGLLPGDLRTLEALAREAFRRDPEIDDAEVSIELLELPDTSAQAARVTVLLQTRLGATTIEATV
jgi:phage baseplate assembly protein W